MITSSELKQHLDYNPQTGHFTRLTTHRQWRAGTRAGSKTVGGYRTLSINQTQILEHRAAFLWMTGEIPLDMVDHIDGDRANNVWSNLRLANAKINGENRRRASSRSKSGVLGVHRAHADNAWIAQIHSGGKTEHLGSFRTVEEAAAAYDAAKRLKHPAAYG